MSSNVAVAERFARLTSERLHYDEGAGCFREWSLNHWRVVSNESSVQRQVAALLEEDRRSTTMRMVQDTVDLCRLYLARPFAGELGGLVPFENGYYEVATGRLLPPAQLHGVTYVLPYPWIEGAECPRTLEFLNALLPSSVAVEAFLAHLGLALLRDRTFHRALLLVGPGGCGKSTLLRLANLLVGQSAPQTFDACLFTGDTEGMRERHEARRELLCCHDEFPRSVLMDDAMFKKMSAHQEVSSRQIYGRASSGQWLPKFLIASNDLPILADRSGALARRLIVLKCKPRTGPDHPCYEEVLAEELGGLARLCLDHARAAIAARAYPIDEGMTAAYETAALTSDPVKLWVEQDVTLGVGAVVSLIKAYLAYRDFVADLGYKETNLTQFERRITDFAGWGVRSEKIGKEVYLMGMRVPHPGEEEGLLPHFTGLSNIELAGLLIEVGARLYREGSRWAVECGHPKWEQALNSFLASNRERGYSLATAIALLGGEKPTATLFQEDEEDEEDSA